MKDVIGDGSKRWREKKSDVWHIWWIGGRNTTCSHHFIGGENSRKELVEKKVDFTLVEKNCEACIPVCRVMNLIVKKNPFTMPLRINSRQITTSLSLLTS